jgi:geranylgeranyl transferase type-2 subunit beta
VTRYLQQLTLRLARGAAELSPERRSRHASWLLGQQCADGGFAGREGGSDLYYTSFAMRSLAILGELSGEPADRVAAYLKGRLGGREALVDFFSLLYAAELLRVSADIDIFRDRAVGWRDSVSNFLNGLRRDDGGFAKTDEGSASSTYQTFLVCIAMELLEQPIHEPQRIIEFVRSQQVADGGFREIRVAQRGGTNPTAAAIGTTRILGFHDPNMEERTIDFLFERQNDEGGLTANTRIPIADVLSTFTGLVTLTDLEAIDELDLEAVEQFVLGLESSDGGFRAANWDDKVDVEYSFYALGTLSLLADHRSLGSEE